uniref:BHLH domain-containing protein n=1 Tax=Oryza brachyantha TaxID=4533 RepID=J3MSZ5_ORYBR
MERRLVAVAGSGRRRWTPAGGGAAAAGVALRRKVRELRRLVPGGEEAPARSLLVRTADYIVRLRARVELLRALSAFYDLPRHDGAGAGVPPRP